MGNIIIWHSKNWYLGHGTGRTLHNSRTLIKCRQFTVKITRIPLSAGDFTFQGRNLTHRLCKRGHIRQNYKNVHIFLKSKILCRCQCHFRSNETLHHRVIGEIQKHYHMGTCTTLLKSPLKVFCHIIFNTHSGKNHRKFFTLVRIISKTCLLYNLSSQRIMGQTVSRKNRQLLPTD